MRGWLFGLGILVMGCSDATIKTFNAEPTATINSHVEGDEIGEEAVTALFGKIADSNHSADTLLATWYVDGEVVCDAAPPDAEGATACEAVLPTGETRVLLEASDPDGASGNDAVRITVIPSTPPEVSILDPFVDGSYRADEPIRFRGRILDAEDGFDRLSAWWNSSEDGDLDLDTTLGEDGMVDDYASLSAGTHVITLGAEDSSGKTNEVEVIIEVGGTNTAPNLTSVEITPDTGVTIYTALSCNAVAEDDDGTVPTISYAWDIDGTAVGTGDALDLTTTAGTSGDTVTCTATATDGTDETTGTDSVVIENTAPQVDSVVLTPDEVYTNDTITATVTTSDAEGEAVTVNIDWYVEGSLVASGPGTTLSGVSDFDKHDEVYVVATPNDGTEDGSPVTSDILTVLNTPPTAPAVSIAEAAGGICPDGWSIMDDEQRCVQIVADTSITWTDANSACTSTGGHLVRIASAADNDQIVDLAISAGLTHEHLWIGYQDLDSEGDWSWTDGEPTTYENWRDGEPFSGDDAYSHCGTLYHYAAMRGLWNDLECDHTSNLGGYACQVTTDTSLVCTIDTPSTDDDGDTVSYTFDWDVDGTPFTDTETTTETGDTVPSDALGYDETWTCEVTPNDGDEDGDTGSASWFIEGPIDDDGDGYTVDEDCDDTDASIHPTAGDSYGDGVDGDCDGLDCEAAWYRGTYFVACYDPRTWDSAQTTCHGAGYDGLVSITSEAENTFVAELLPVSGSETSYLYWIGFTDQDAEGSWTWSSGLDVTYTNWNSGEPSDGGLGSEDCGHMYPSWFPVFGRWNDHDCSLGQSYVCELRGDGCWDTSFGDSSYTFCDGPKTRVDAEADCLEREMDLVKIDSSDENDFIWEESVTMGGWGHPGPWIGLQDEDLDGTFAWNDGTAMTYEDWCPGHPIDPGSRAYVHMEVAASDYPCWAANGSSSTAEIQYVCEYEHTDEDGDGYTTLDDCNDEDPSIHPMAGDIYEDGIDQDCDGLDCEAAWHGTTYFALCEMSEWEEGGDLCDAGGYDFGSVRSDDENLFITELMRDSVLFFYPGALVGEAIWLGYSDRTEEGVWVWEDGYTGAYTNWAPGEPNDSGGQDCAYLDTNPTTRDGEWDDANCDIGGDRVILCNAR